MTGSGGVIEDCTFRGGMAVAVKRGSDIHISGSTFRDCLLGLNLDEARHDVRIEGNVFEGGGTGILCQNFSTPWIACCEFRNLENGVVATRQSRPMVRHCLFGGNKRGIDVNQKSDPPLEKNLFRDNDTAVFIDMSSYPRLRENDFAREEMAVALGIYMSADWERRVGSGGLSRGEASRRGSRNMGDIEKMGAYGGEVDARENWWGAEATAEMKRLGPDGDITVIDDYFDRPEVSYPGFGEGAYRLDRVIYHPWLVTAVADAGPVAGGCGDIEFEPAKPRQEQKPDR